MWDLRRIIHRNYSTEVKIRIVLECLHCEDIIAEHCCLANEKVLRPDSNNQYRVTNRQSVLKNKGLTRDQTIRRTNTHAAKKCSSQLRRVSHRDFDTGKHYIFLTNNFKLAARTIADIYKARWQVELFFKWIRQILKIKSFIETSKNAVMTQIWIAMLALASGFHQIPVKDKQNHAPDLAITIAQSI